MFIETCNYVYLLCFMSLHCLMIHYMVFDSICWSHTIRAAATRAKIWIFFELLKQAYIKMFLLYKHYCIAYFWQILLLLFLKFIPCWCWPFLFTTRKLYWNNWVLTLWTHLTNICVFFSFSVYLSRIVAWWTVLLIDVLYC